MRPEPDANEFAELLMRYRTARNLSQGQLAKAAHLSRTYVYHLEHGLRQAPSTRAIRAIMRALELRGEERRRFIQVFSDLTGEFLEEESDEASLLDLGHLAALLVENTIFPAHSLDRQWRIASWNRAALDLFEVSDALLEQHEHHLIRLVFDPAYRRRFQPWEDLARKLTADFKYQTRDLTFLPDFRDLVRALKRMPDYRRLSEVSEATSAPAPSFIFHMRHSRLGSLALRTAISVFSASPGFSIVVYLPGSQQALETFKQCGWQQSDDQDI